MRTLAADHSIDVLHPLSFVVEQCVSSGNQMTGRFTTFYVLHAEVANHYGAVGSSFHQIQGVGGTNYLYSYPFPGVIMLKLKQTKREKKTKKQGFYR